MHQPSNEELRTARMCRRLGKFLPHYYSIESITVRTLVVMFAGYRITYRYQDNETTRSPTDLPGLSSDDMQSLDELAEELFRAAVEGQRYANEARKAAARKRRRIKAQEDLYEREYGPQRNLF